MSIEPVLWALRQLRWGGGEEGYAVSWPGLMWPELPGSMWPEAVMTWKKRSVATRLKGIAWASVFCFLFDVSMAQCFHVSTSLCLCLHVSMSPSPCLHVSMSPCLQVSMSMFHVSRILLMENGTKGKQQLSFVCCKNNTETTNFLLFASNGNGKRKFLVFFHRQTINGDWQLLFQQTCPSMLIFKRLFPYFLMHVAYF